MPENERNEMLRVLHLGHYGTSKMNSRAKDTVFWPGIYNDIENTVHNCEVCNTTSRVQQKETLKPHDLPFCAWERVGIDLFEINRVHYLLVVDYYSRFPFVRRLHSLNTKSIVTKLKEIFS